MFFLTQTEPSKFVQFFLDIWQAFYKSFLKDQRYLIYLEGFGNTILIAIGAGLLGLILGFLVTTIRLAPKNHVVIRILDKICSLYVTVIRGTPVVLQLLIMDFVVLRSINSIGGGIPVAILTFGLNSGAYMTEIIRGGILAIDKGQMEAGRSLGFNWIQSMWYIVLPQGLKNALPTMFNEFIMLVKETSVAGYVAIIDLTKASQIVTSQAFEVFTPLCIIAVIYLIVVLGLQKLQKSMERRLRRGD